jgi:hypothetical protein
MPVSSISGSVSSPQVDVVIDMGNPYLNLTVDGFLKIGTVITDSKLLQLLHSLKHSEPTFFFFRLQPQGHLLRIPIILFERVSIYPFLLQPFC